MSTFALVMRITQTKIGGLIICSLEMTSGFQAIHHLVSLLTSDISSKLLLLTTTEYHHLEVGVEQLFLSSSHAKPHKLAISTWTTHLWELIHLYCLEECLPAIKLPLYSFFNKTALADALLSAG